MPRVHILKARKNYPTEGIKKGDTYYKWSTRITIGKTFRSTIHRSKTRPSRAQLTRSDFYGAIYALFDGAAPSSPDEVRQMAEDLRGIGEEQTSKFDNMPEGLQQGDTGRMLEERASACEDSASELEAIADEWETAEEEHAREVDEFDPDEEGAEHPGEFDPSEFIDRISETEPSI